MCDMAYFQTLTTIIDYLYKQLNENKEQVEHLKKLKEEQNEDAIKNIYEGIFVFAVIWSFGASLNESKLSFSSALKNSASKIKFPEQGQVFDYYFDIIQGTWVHWENKVSPFDTEYEGLYNNLVVPTAETTRQRFMMDMHRLTNKGVMYVGNAGTGKTTMIKDYFTHVDSETTITAAINFNSYTDSKALQAVIEGNVDKRTGKIYGPPTGKILIFFMDDLNMPYVDKYGTQSPICLIRQIIDYALIFDRDHLEEKKTLQDIMFTACMNPKSGSFNVDMRLSRHFTVVCLGVPEKEILNTIYLQILQNHMQHFDTQCRAYAARIINATSVVFNSIALSPQFMPTARKFHY